MRLSNYKFKLPEELIAQFPSRFRDEARLLVLHAKTGEIEHKMMNATRESLLGCVGRSCS